MKTFHRSLVATSALAVALTTASCGGGDDDGNPGTNEGSLAVADCDPSAGPFSLSITNPFFPLPVGRQLVFDGIDDGEPLHLVITVLDDTEVVAGVTTRVVEEREEIAGELVEVSRNFFAQEPNGAVCYFGEDVDIFEDGGVSHDGAWRAGVDGAVPGIIMPADPQVGDTYQQEVAPGVAEDRAEVIARGGTVTVPAGTFEERLDTFEDTPLEPGTGSNKTYARDLGLVIDDDAALTSFTP